MLCNSFQTTVAWEETKLGVIDRHHFETSIRGWRKETHKAYVEFFTNDVDFTEGWSEGKVTTTRSR